MNNGYQRDATELKLLQSYPLDIKVSLSRNRIYEWADHWGDDHCVVSFSGGKDSTVLLHLVRTWIPDCKAVFSNTGLEYPEIQRFVKSFDNVDIVTPGMRFDQVVSTYGYPIISKEVAEAIYYARRLSGSKEREKQKDWKRIELSGKRERTGSETQGTDGTADDKPWFIQTGSARNRRTILQGKWCGTGAEPSGQKSMFNKEKYLPLARDIPVAVSHYCCNVMKKSPIKKYQRKNKYHPFLGTLADESRVRKQAWIRHGCNMFDGNTPTSQPLSFWTEQDILMYIVKNNIEIPSVYGDIVFEDEDGNEYSARDAIVPGCKLKCTGCERTGCVFCAFGFHNEKGETRFQRLAKTHPKQYEYAIGGGQWADNPAYDPTAPKMDGEWQNWNPKKIWVPSKKGLGMGKVFDMVNEIYGKDFYRYD